MIIFSWAVWNQVWSSVTVPTLSYACMCMSLFSEHAVCVLGSNYTIRHACMANAGGIESHDPNTTGMSFRDFAIALCRGLVHLATCTRVTSAQIGHCRANPVMCTQWHKITQTSMSGQPGCNQILNYLGRHNYGGWVMSKIMRYTLNVAVYQLILRGHHCQYCTTQCKNCTA